MALSSDFQLNLVADLTYDLVQTGSARLRAAGFGDAEQQALWCAWESAFETMLETVAADLESDHANLVVNVFRDFVRSDDVADALLDLVLTDREPPLLLLQARFGVLDFDRVTLPVDFNVVLTALTRGLIDALLTKAMAPDRSLYNRVSLVRVTAIHSLLQKQHSSLAAIAATVSRLEQRLPEGAKYNLVFLDPVSGIAIGDQAIVTTGLPPDLRPLLEHILALLKEKTAVHQQPQQKDADCSLTDLVPVQAPVALPSYFVPRPEISDDLKIRLLDDETSGPGVLIVSAIHGLGGIGKSTLAAAMAHDPDVWRRFPNGILWATLGPNPNILFHLRGWIQALGDQHFLSDDVKSASKRLRTLLHDKACLLVVDDIWRADDIYPFLVGGEHCHVLITTRERLVAEAIGATRYDLDAMTLEQALALLSGRLDRSFVQDERGTATALARVVGYLPLALELAAAQIADGISWENLLDDLRAEVSRLESLDLPGMDEVGDEEIAKRLSLRASFALSLRRLKPEVCAAFAWLGVLPEDTVINQAMATTLWDLSDERIASDRLRLLHYKALLLPAPSVHIGERELKTYRIHNLVHNTARHVLTTQPSDRQYGFGLGLTLIEARTVVLNNYRKQSQGKWHTVPEDGYFGDHLIYHLQNSGQLEEIHKLFLTEGWAKRRSPVALLGDFECARRTLSEKTEVAVSMRYILFAEIVKQRYEKFPVEALPVALKKGLATPETLMAAIRSMEAKKPEDRVRAYLGVAAQLPLELHELYSEEIIQIAEEVGEIEVFKELMPFVYGEALQRAQRVFWLLAFDLKKSQRNVYLDWILPQLRHDELVQLEKDILNIESPYRRANIIEKIAPHFDKQTRENLWVLVFKSMMADNLQGYIAGEMFGFLVPLLPPKYQEQASYYIQGILESIPYWESVEFFQDVFDPLVPYLPTKDVPAAWERAVFEVENHDRYWGELCLLTLVSFLPQESIPTDFDFRDHIPSSASEEIKACVNIAMAYRLPLDSQDREYFESWKTLVSNFSKGDDLCAFLSASAAKLSSKAITDSWFFTLGADIPERYRGKRGLDYAQSQSRFHRRKDLVLTALATYLPDGLLKEACAEIVQRYNREAFPALRFGTERRESGWIGIFETLLERIDSPDGSIWQEALEYILSEEPDEHYHNVRDALVLASEMPCELQVQGWRAIEEAVLKIESAAVRATRLADCADYFPDSMKGLIWLKAWKTVAMQEDTYYLEYVVLKLRKIYPLLSVKQRAELAATDWQSDILRTWFERPVLAGYDSDLNKALLLNLSPPTFVYEVVQGGYKHSALPLLIAFFPFLSLDEQEQALVQMTKHMITKDYPEALILERWDGDSVWRAWRFVQKIDADKDWNYGNWAVILTLLLPEERVWEAWHLALQNSFSVHWPLWPEICMQLSARIPRAHLSEAWLHIESLEHQKCHWYFGRGLKSIIASRLSDDFLLSLAQPVESNPTIPKDIFVCQLRKYVQFVIEEFREQIDSIREEVKTLISWQIFSNINWVRMLTSAVEILSLFLSRSRAMSVLREAQGVSELALMRLFLQRVGGRRLRRDVDQAYNDSLTWWREALKGTGKPESGI